LPTRRATNGAFIGSRSLCGLLDDAEIDRLTNRSDGTPLRGALENAGFAGSPRQQIAPDRYARELGRGDLAAPGHGRGFLEAHIEQGDFLDSADLRLGIVTSIVGIWQYRIHFEGEQNHAGPTRMAIRKDAGLALVRLAAAIDRRFPVGHRLARASQQWLSAPNGAPGPAP
jgi:N-carbamoyl-L-amino-acid hydrolase